MKQVGVLSDTHGILSRQAFEALKGVDAILHAGDVGDIAIIEYLSQLAPVTAVRGNTDGGKQLSKLLETELITLSAVGFYILHDYNRLDIDPASAGVQAVISGHTHRPSIQWSGGVLYFNPGSATQARNGGPLSIGKITLTPEGPAPEIIKLGF